MTAEPTAPASPGASPMDFIRALRPTQWTKNIVVVAAFVFAFWDRSRHTPLHFTDLAVVIPALILFCLVSSSIYVLNDLRDREADRHHPQKRFRPIAAGRITLAQAIVLAAALLLTGLGGAWWMSPPFAMVVMAYAVLQVAYTLWLKHVALLDTMSIATGFVLRAVAGARVLPDVSISPWLLVCTFLLALFLALCKRRHEKLIAGDAAGNQRPSLEQYSRRGLDLLIAATSVATVGAYAAYTLWPATVEKFGTAGLAWTIPFVLIGIARYIQLVYRHDKGEQPERVLLTDFPLLLTLTLYGLTVILVLRP